MGDSKLSDMLFQLQQQSASNPLLFAHPNLNQAPPPMPVYSPMAQGAPFQMHQPYVAAGGFDSSMELSDLLINQPGNDLSSMLPPDFAPTPASSWDTFNETANPPTSSSASSSSVPAPKPNKKAPAKKRAAKPKQTGKESAKETKAETTKKSGGKASVKGGAKKKADGGAPATKKQRSKTAESTEQQYENNRLGKDENEVDEKKAKSLERNRKAASRCRERKKQFREELRRKEDILEQENREMHLKMETLRNEIGLLKERLQRTKGADAVRALNLSPFSDANFSIDSYLYSRQMEHSQSQAAQAASSSSSSAQKKKRKGG